MTTLVTPAASDPGHGTAPSLRPGTLPGMIPPDVPAPPQRRGWWRRNAVWLVLLPVAIVVAAGASSFRVWAFWWPDGLHHEVDHAAAGESAHLEDEYVDLLAEPEQADSTVRRAIDATVTGVEQVDQLPPPVYGEPVAIPEGSVVYEVRMHFAADPETDVSGCQIILVAEDGTRYGESTKDLLGNLYRCAAPGADSNVSVQPEWDSTSYVLADPDVEITQVRLAFGGPEYVTIDLY
jgi:hypothetical protein